jgi:hypothetical protein
MAEREIEKVQEGGRGEERGERIAMHDRKRKIENLQQCMAEREIEKAFREGGRGKERGERVAMHGSERNK